MILFNISACGRMCIPAVARFAMASLESRLDVLEKSLVEQQVLSERLAEGRRQVKESIDRLQDTAKWLSSQVTDLTYKHHELCRAFYVLSMDGTSLLDDHEALCGHLSAAGLITLDALQAQRRARRHAQLWRSALQRPELAVAIAQATGVQGARRISEASKGHKLDMRAALPRVMALAPPEIFVFGGSDGYEPLAVADRLDTRRDRWEQEPLPMPIARYGCAAAAALGSFYVTGGHNSTQQVVTVERFEPDSGRWIPAPAMNCPRDGCAAATVRGMIYVVGGFNGTSRLPTVERFDPVAQVWQAMPPMSFGRSSCAVAALDGSLYVAGGYDGRQRLSAVERFVPTTHVWEEMPMLLMARGGCAAAVARSRLYVVGGHDGLLQPVAASEALDPRKCTWEEAPSMPTARFGLAMVSVDNRLYALGGHDGRQRLAAVERFDPITNVWEKLSPMPTARYECAAAVGRR